MSRANAIIIHGKPKEEDFRDSEKPLPNNAYWIPHVREEFIARNIRPVTPLMPRPYFPVYKAWKDWFKYQEITPQTSLIGHSAGASFLLRWLSEESDLRVRWVGLIAPWVDPNHKYEDFGEYEIDHRLTERCLGGISVFHSSLDDDQARTSLEIVKSALPTAHYIDLPAFGHYKIPELPELFEEFDRIAA